MAGPRNVQLTRELMGLPDQDESVRTNAPSTPDLELNSRETSGTAEALQDFQMPIFAGRDLPIPSQFSAGSADAGSFELPPIKPQKVREVAVSPPPDLAPIPDLPAHVRSQVPIKSTVTVSPPRSWAEKTDTPPAIPSLPSPLPKPIHEAGYWGDRPTPQGRPLDAVSATFGSTNTDALADAPVQSATPKATPLDVDTVVAPWKPLDAMSVPKMPAAADTDDVPNVSAADRKVDQEWMDATMTRQSLPTRSGGTYRSRSDPHGQAKEIDMQSDESLGQLQALENSVKLQDQQMRQGVELTHMLTRAVDRIVVDAGFDYRLLTAIVSGLEFSRNTITDSSF